LTLCGHTDALCALAWSPDDAQLLTCGHDELLRLWALETGECMHAYRKHTESVVACAWLPTGTHFVSAGVDKLVLLWSVDGTLLQVLQGQRVYDLSAVSSVELVAISGREICTYSITYSSEDGLPQLHAPGTTPSMLEDQPITSITLSADSRHALCTVISAEVQEIHLWDLGSGSRIHRYRGHTHGRYVLRACFGGEGECLIVSASEDTQVYIWDRHTEALLEVLPSHSGSVNAVSWCPSRGLLASASDDCTVRLWSAQGALEEQALS